MSHDPKHEFEQAGEEPQGSLLAELIAMLRQNKKYWLIPLVGTLLLLGVLIILGGTAAGPFIYPLF
jgi:hypothetical protein